MRLHVGYIYTSSAAFYLFLFRASKRVTLYLVKRLLLVCQRKDKFPIFFSSALYLDEYALIQYYMPLSLEKASSKLEIRLEQDTNHLHMNVVRVFL